MNRNVKDYLILKADFDFAIPWITLGLGDEPQMSTREEGGLKKAKNLST